MSARRADAVRGRRRMPAAPGKVAGASSLLPPPGVAIPPRRSGGVGVFLLAVVTAGALAHVAVRLKGLEVAYDLGHERAVATELEEQRRRLQIEIGMLKDPARVISIARERLNMGPPAPEAIWRLGSGALARMPVTPGSERPGLPASASAAVAVPRAGHKLRETSSNNAAAATTAAAPTSEAAR